MVLLMQFRRLSGPYCRDCGIATVRQMSGETLWQGWWGPASFFITPFTLLINLVRRIQFGRMQEPMRHFGASTPMPVGRPLYRRWAMVGVLVPLLAVVAVVSAPGSGGSSNKPSTTVPPAAPVLVGRCMTIEESNGEISGALVGCGATHQGRIVAEVDSDADCPNDTEWFFEKTTGSDVICVAKD
jgi:hypothetical protein